MRTNRKFTAILLSLVMAFSLLPAPAVAAGGPCNHTNAKATVDGSEIDSTLEQVAVSTSYDCTQGAVIKAYYVCSGCDKKFSAYESNASDTNNVIQTSDEGTYIKTAETAHTFDTSKADGACTNTVTPDGGSELTCTGTCTHDWSGKDGTCKTCAFKCATHDWSQKDGVCATCGFECDHDSATTGTCSTCGKNLDGGGTTPGDDECKGTETQVGVCQATTHIDGCIDFCTKNESCTATKRHQDGCPKASTDPGTDPGGDEEDSALTISSYDYSTGALSFRYTGGGEETEFYVAIYKGSLNDLDASTPIEEETLVKVTAGENNVRTGTYKLTTTLDAGTYCICVHTGSDKDYFEFKVTASGTTTPEVPDVTIPADGGAAGAEEAIGGAISGADEMTKETADATISAVTEATSDMSSAAKEDFSEQIVNSNDLDSNITTLEAKAGKTPMVSATNAPVSGVSVVGLGMNASGSAVPKLTVSTTTEQSKKPTNTGMTFFALTVTGVDNSAQLSYPAKITIDIPASMQGTGKSFSIIHYSSNGNYTTVPSSMNGTTKITFATWSFSDFAIVATGGKDTGIGGTTNKPGTTDPGTSGNKTPSKGGSSGGGSSAKPATSTTPTTPNNGGTTVTTTPTQVFKDIPANHWASAQIKWAYDNKCMNGTGDGAFTPNGTVTRQALWMVLARLAGSNPADMAAAKAWAVENSISDGTTPSGAVSRQQLVTILYRFAQMMAKDTQGAAELSSYPDAASVASYAQDALAWAVGNGIVSGTSDGRLNPEGSATRAQFAVILYRFYNGEQAQ